MRRKAEQADEMFKILVREMSASTRVEPSNEYINAMERPSWLQ